MSERNDKELKEWLVKRAYNITASKMVAIVAEYSDDPYWSTIPVHGDAFAVYVESKLTKEQLHQRSKDSSQHYTRFGNFVEPFTFDELLRVLDLSSSLKKENIIYNIHQEYEGEEKIACTPDYIVKDFSPYLLDVFNRLPSLDEIKNFFFVAHPEFKANGNAFLLECKAKSLNQTLKDYRRDDEGNLIPSDAIILQLQTQLLVTDVKWGIVGTLVFTDEGLKLHFYFMNADEYIQKIIKKSVNRYFEDIKKGNIPVPKDQWDKSVDYMSFEGIVDKKSKVLKAPKEIKRTERDLGDKQGEVEDLIQEIMQLEESLKESSEKVQKVKTETKHDTLADRLKLQKKNLDKYLQLLIESKGSYELTLKIKDNLYKIALQKEPDYVCNKQTVYKTGDIIKKGARNLEVTKI